jgi:hypothetical protein
VAGPGNRKCLPRDPFHLSFTAFNSYFNDPFLIFLPVPVDCLDLFDWMYISYPCTIIWLQTRVSYVGNRIKSYLLLSCDGLVTRLLLLLDMCQPRGS